MAAIPPNRCKCCSNVGSNLLIVGVPKPEKYVKKPDEKRAEGPFAREPSTLLSSPLLETFTRQPPQTITVKLEIINVHISFALISSYERFEQLTLPHILIT